MANVMSLKKLRNKPSRNGFDLSKRNIFSAKVGELLPVYCKEVIPGDKFNINVKSFTRTMPVNTAAYTRIKEYYDWFFVPTNLLWNKFNTFVSQMSDNNQHAAGTATNVALTSEHPYFTLQQLVTYLRGFNHYPNENFFGFNRGYLTCKLLDYLGYSDLTNLFVNEDKAFDSVYSDNPALNPFPLLAYQKIYADYYRDSQWEKAFAPAFNIDYITGNGDLNIPVSSISSDAMNNETMFDLRYCNWNKDLFMGVRPNAQFGDAASIDLSSIINSDFSSSAPNIDLGISLLNTGSAGDVANVQSSLSNYRVLDAGGSRVFYLDDVAFGRIAQGIGLTSSNLQSAFTILALRQAEALQKWKEITQSQQQDYKSQMEAHFGVSLSDAYSERCHYIDGFSDTIDINEVVNTNLTDGSTRNIADIAGKGVGVNDGYTSFSSDVHGYLMCVYHAVPLLDYSLESRIPRQNLKTQVTDYAIPELDKTGMVQVPIIEMTNDINVANIPDGLLGYAPRYYDYKTDVDEIHGSARNRNSSWVAPFDDTYLLNLFGITDLNKVPRNISFDFFKVNPTVLDPIFAAQTSADSSTESDQLLTNCYFDVKAVRNLDYDGLPY